MSLSEKQEALIREVNALGDCLDQYSYLLIQASQFPGIPAEQRRDEELVRGCQSQVWLRCTLREGRFHLEADSDTLLIQGVLQLLTRLLEGEPPKEIAETELNFLTRTELSATFTKDRNTGMAAIFSQIKHFCREALK